MRRAFPIAPTVIPTLDELAADPTRAQNLSANLIQAMLCRCAMAQTVLLGSLLNSFAQIAAPEPVETEALINVAAAAQRLGVSKDWLYRHARNLPFTVRQGRRLLFSARGIDRYIRSREGRLTV
jgi:hypothetical protein